VKLGQIEHPRDQPDQSLAIGGLHVLAGRDVGFGEPFARQVAAIRGVVLRDVARDVDELEGEPEVARAVERLVVVVPNPHHVRHHHPDGPGDVVAIAHQVGFGVRLPAFGVELEAADHVLGHLHRQPGFLRDLAEGVERRVGGRLPSSARRVSTRIAWMRFSRPAWSPSLPPNSCPSAMSSQRRHHA
jgi:hypothetical protein